jgi:hypothetical protein
MTKALVMPDDPNKQRGMVIVKAEAIKESNHQIGFQLFAKDLVNKVPVCGGIMWFNGRTQWAVER